MIVEEPPLLPPTHQNTGCTTHTKLAPCFSHLDTYKYDDTLLETNSSHLKKGGWNANLIDLLLGWLRDYVSFRKCIHGNQCLKVAIVELVCWETSSFAPQTGNNRIIHQ